MRSHFVRLFVPVLVLIGFGSSLPTAHAQTFYSPTVLDTLGGTYATAEGMNDAGHVVGVSLMADRKQRAFLWTGSGAPVAIPTLGGATNTARAINNAGHVVGDSYTTTGQVHAYVYRDGGVVDLGALPDGTGGSTANDISDAGIVVGSSMNTLGLYRAVLWEDGQIRDLGTLGTWSVATGVNERKQVVGYSGLSGGIVHAFLWENGLMRDLGSSSPNGMSQALAINEAGTIVGSAGTSSKPLPVLWDPSGAIREIKLPAGDDSGGAAGINDHGQVIGTSSSSLNGTRRVFLYNALADVVESLESLVPATPAAMPVQVVTINNSGQIAGSSIPQSVYYRALRLDPSSMPRLLFVSQPHTAYAGVPFVPALAVQAWDAMGRVVTNYAETVTLTVKPGTGAAGAILAGTTTAQVVNGVASFEGVALDRPGLGYVLQATGLQPDGLAALPGSSMAFPVGLTRIHVQSTGADTNSGQNWSSSMKTISAAIGSPFRFSQTEVWVAAGLYSEAVSLTPGTTLFGGFAGIETVRGERDPRQNVTEISDPKRDVAVNVPTGATPSTVLDGFTIRGGGVGVQCYDASPTIRNCVIDRTWRGIECEGSVASPVIESNVVSGSTGTGIYLITGRSIVRNNLIRGNRSYYSDGGGIVCSGAGAIVEGAPEITGNTIVENLARAGGGISMSGPVVVRNNLFIENVAWDENGYVTVQAGGAIHCRGGAPLIVNNTFLANSAKDGGQISVSSGTPTIANNLFAYGNSGLHVAAGTVVLRHNAFWKNGLYETEGVTEGLGVNGNIEANPALANVFARNVHLQPGSPLVDAGDGAYAVTGDLDMDGQPRVQGAAVDIGVDESDGTAWTLERGVVRVRPDGDDAGDGRTWATAKRTLAAAVAATSYGGEACGDEVWVAEGVYPGAVDLASFTSLYGGFVGIEETRDQRDPARHRCIIESTDRGVDVLTVKPGGQIVEVDGMTARNGLRGIHVRSGATATVTNNTFEYNARHGIVAGGQSLIAGNHCVFNGHEDGGGAGIRATDTAVVTGNVVERNAYRKNAAGFAGGIEAFGQVEVAGNVVRDNIGAGIGVQLYHDTIPAVRNNIVTGNTGNGIWCLSGGNPILNNVVAHNGGIGLYLNGNNLVANNTVVGNRKNYLLSGAGGIFCRSQPTLVNNIIAFNNGGIWSDIYPDVPLAARNNCVFGNNLNGGVDFSADLNFIGKDGNISADPRLAGIADGNFHIQPDSPCVDAGDAAGLPDGLSDIDATERLQGARIDIGADESDGTVWAAATYRVYVTPGGNDTADGQTWSGAKRSIQAGINAARNAGGGEVWVAGGTYPENIHMGAYTRVYGGFHGDETDLSQRVDSTLPSILDAGGRATVASPRGLGIGSVLDGFTLRNGTGSLMYFGTEDYACGGGLQLTDSYMTISNNVITGNAARQGGGIWTRGGEPAIRDNVISDNTATEFGGGIYRGGGGGVVINNIIASNSAPQGGGIVARPLVDYMTEPTLLIARNVVRDNQGTDGAGLMLVGSILQARSNLIVGNTATGRGGGIFATSNPNLVNNTLAGNVAAEGGAVYVGFSGGSYNQTNGRLTNNILTGNSSGVFVEAWARAILNYNDVFGNAAYNFSGMTDPTGIGGNISQAPLFIDTTAGDYRLRAGSPARDTGRDSEVLAGEADLAGHPRLVGAHVDMGGYEMPPVPTIEDAVRALRLAGGLMAATESDMQRATEMTAESQDTGITIETALRMLRQSLGALSRDFPDRS